MNGAKLVIGEVVDVVVSDDQSVKSVKSGPLFDIYCSLYNLCTQIELWWLSIEYTGGLTIRGAHESFGGKRGRASYYAWRWWTLAHRLSTLSFRAIIHWRAWSYVRLFIFDFLLWTLTIHPAIQLYDDVYQSNNHDFEAPVIYPLFVYFSRDDALFQTVCPAIIVLGFALTLPPPLPCLHTPSHVWRYFCMSPYRCSMSWSRMPVSEELFRFWTALKPPSLRNVDMNTRVMFAHPKISIEGRGDNLLLAARYCRIRRLTNTKIMKLPHTTSPDEKTLLSARWLCVEPLIRVRVLPQCKVGNRKSLYCVF